MRCTDNRSVRRCSQIVVHRIAGNLAMGCAEMTCATQDSRIKWYRQLTTLHADTRSYISIPASARANDAAVIVTAASEPPDSSTKQYTSTFDLGKVCRCTAACNAACTVDEISRSSGLCKYRSAHQLQSLQVDTVAVCHDRAPAQSLCCVAVWQRLLA